MDKFLLVGLGNPGEKYHDTKHNIGFRIANLLVKRFQSDFKLVKYGELAAFKIKGHQIYVLKPSTFMNLSGKAVRYHMLHNKIKLNNLLIFTDDLHLPFGKMRLKSKGSDGGHNGHKDIIEKLSTSDYPRLRFGIGNKFQKGSQSNYVLSDWTDKESIQLDNFIDLAVDAIVNFCILGLDNTMSQFNS